MGDDCTEFIVPNVFKTEHFLYKLETQTSLTRTVLIQYDCWVYFSADEFSLERDRFGNCTRHKSRRLAAQWKSTGNLSATASREQ